jgi:TolB-like protein/DNA-binding SARP family transcriptional activator/Tfp pilus assembly protein PilF
MLGRWREDVVKPASRLIRMLELRTLGGLSLEVNGAPCTGAAAQRKTLALLALLARHSRGLSRDKLIAYLWPEADDEHGRSLLRQGCYALRRDLNADDLFIGSTELRLNPAIVASDVQMFEAALERADLRRAVGLYAGPFLDGVYLSEAGEFERWAEVERARLAQRMADAIESLAREAGGRGEHRAAIDWWRRLATLDPLSARAALGLMAALDEAGEPAEAIREGRAHSEFVRQELGADPAAEVSVLIGQLQNQSASGRHAVREAGQGEITAAVTVPTGLLRRVRRATALSLAAVIAAAFLVAGVGAYAVWSRAGGAGRTVSLGGRKMLAVLPLENRGAAGDEYFADGLSEAITARLGSIRRLGVIAWQSARQYKGSRKSLQEIGRELGAQYVVEGTVRWERRRGGPSRIRVTPALIRVSDGAQLWAEQYDTIPAGVFAIQANLATRVAGALDIVMGDAERQLLEARPTANLEAYDAYLRGREALQGDWDPADLRMALHMFEHAVALDSTFAVAVAWLTITNVRMYWNYVDRDLHNLTRAKALLNHLLRVAPDLPETHEASGFYFYEVVRDYDRAVSEFAIAERGRPSDAELAGVIGSVYERQGRWNDAVTYGHEAVLLDPRNSNFTSAMGDRYTALRQYAAANYYYERALALTPRSVSARLTKAIGHVNLTGDRFAAQKMFPDVSENIAPTGLQSVVITLTDVVLLLNDEQQTRLLQLTPATLGGDSAAVALAKAFVYRARHDTARALASFDSARVVLVRAALSEPEDRLDHALLGLALAGLGRGAEAVTEGERAVALLPVSLDAVDGALPPANLARIYVLLGEREKAIDQLQIVLSRPGPLSPNWLRADPFWEPLRESPRFGRLVGVRN